MCGGTIGKIDIVSIGLVPKRANNEGQKGNLRLCLDKLGSDEALKINMKNGSKINDRKIRRIREIIYKAGIKIHSRKHDKFFYLWLA